jgi:SPP1 family phage portal protein
METVMVTEEDEDGNQIEVERQVPIHSDGKNQMAVYGGDPENRAEFLKNPLDPVMAESLRNTIKSDIHEISYVPNMNDESFGGNVSGVAMQWKVFMLLNLLATKYKYYKRGVRERVKITCAYLHFIDNKVQIDASKIDIGMKVSMPINLSDIIDNIAKAQAFYPLVKALEWLPDADNPKELLDELRKQKEDDLAFQQKALGVSHKDVEVVEEVK